jgi:hypothetical protein
MTKRTGQRLMVFVIQRFEWPTGPSRYPGLRALVDRALVSILAAEGDGHLPLGNSAFIVRTNKPPKHWHARLKQVIGQHDTLFIATLDDADGFGGQLPDGAWDWIAANR